MYHFTNLKNDDLFYVNLNKFSQFLYKFNSWFCHWTIQLPTNTNPLLQSLQYNNIKDILWKWHHLVASLLTFWWQWCLWACFVWPTLWHKIQRLLPLGNWRLELGLLCLFLGWSCVLLCWLLLWHSCCSELENNGFKICQLWGVILLLMYTLFCGLKLFEFILYACLLKMVL